MHLLSNDNSLYALNFKYPIYKFPHGLMFHHFHNDKFLKSQGSITKNDLIDIIEFVGPKNILSAELWLEKFLKNQLNPSEVCITFDHGLKCQFEIALPILDSYDLTAFWFVYSSPLDACFDTLEIYRDFRMSQFENIEKFYEFFFNAIKESQFSDKIELGLKQYHSSNFLKNMSFYTENDRKFRYIRDKILSESDYFLIMDNILESFEINSKNRTKELFMNENDLKILKNKNHIIGLHSYSHPTVISNLSFEKQKEEYQKNKNHLENIVGEINTMSHPSNSYDENTLKALNELGIQMGFIADMNSYNSSLEIPRQDHTNIMNMLKKS